MPNDTKRLKAGRRIGRRDRQEADRRPAGAVVPTVAHAKRNYERYMALARDAASAGDPVESENYYQHAEHYLRTMREHAEHGRNSSAA